MHVSSVASSIDQWPIHQGIHASCACRYIDGRVWPEDDELEVRLMMDLIRHVTGSLLPPVAFCALLLHASSLVL